MSTFLIIATAFAVVFGFLAYFLFLIRIYYVHVRNKGYIDPLIVLIFPSILLFALFAGFVGLVISHRTGDNVSIALFLILPVVAATSLIYVGARMLPPKTRIAGARKIRFPWGTAGWAALILGVGQFLYFAITSHWKTETLSTSGKVLAYFAIPASLYCIYIAKRVRAPSVEDVIQVDHRPPVLYVRAFVFEEEFFLYLPAKEASKYSSYASTRYGASFEQYFGAALGASIGPFVALGNPLDYAPPEGASRTYERDEDWKQRFLDMGRAAACILIQVGDSRNLEWEFRALKREGLHEKAFIFTRPKENLGAWARWARWNLQLVQRLKGAKRTVWSEFAAGLRDAGYDIDLTEPPHGSVLGFNHEGSAVFLATGAQSPADFIEVVIRRLQLRVMPN